MKKYGKILFILMMAAFITFIVSIMRPSQADLRKKTYYEVSESKKDYPNGKKDYSPNGPNKNLPNKALPFRESSPVKRNNITGGYWKSGLPYMDINRKLKAREFKFTSISDIKLEMGHIGDLHLPFQKLLADVSVWTNQSQNAFFKNRGSVDKFKPGVLGINLILSDINGDEIYYFPYFKKYEQYLMPILFKILGADPMEKVIRLQFARLSKGAQIKPHQDTGNWARSNHRIHVPITVTPHTQFKIYLKKSEDPELLKYSEGDIFELNNMVTHSVDNEDPDPRIHLILDATSTKTVTPEKIHHLRPGQTCDFKGAVVC